MSIKNKVRYLVVMGCYFIIPFVVFAGEASGIFLDIPSSPRQTSMGGAGIAVAGDGFAHFINPAGLVDIDNGSLAFSYKKGIGGAKSSSIAYSKYQPGFGARGFSLKYTGIESEERFRPVAFEPQYGEKFTNYGVAIGFSFANKWLGSQNLSWGWGIKLIQEKLDDETGNALAADAGLKYNLETKWPVQFGFIVQNIGTELVFIDKTEQLPEKLGAGWSVTAPLWSRSLVISNDFIQNLSESYTEISLGLEYYLSDAIIFRTGYNDIPGETLDSTVSVGLGLRKNNILLDYSFSAGNQLENENQVALSFFF